MHRKSDIPFPSKSITMVPGRRLRRAWAEWKNSLAEVCLPPSLSPPPPRISLVSVGAEIKTELNH